MTATVQEVPLVLSVTDHKGKYVDKLTPSDLMVLDNNQEQTAITFFEHRTNLPLNVAILIDMSSSVAHRFRGSGTGSSGSGSSGSTPPQK